MKRPSLFLLMLGLLSGSAVAQQSMDPVAYGGVINTMAKIYAANLRYQELYKKRACSMGELTAPAAGAKASAEHAGLLDAALVSGKTGEYKYTMSCGGNGAKLAIVATPTVEERPYFCTDQDGATLKESDTVDEKACLGSEPVSLYQVALVKEYCMLASNGMIEAAKCVAKGAMPILPMLMASQTNSDEKTGLSNLRTILTAQEQYKLDNGKYAADMNALMEGGQLERAQGCDANSCELSGYRLATVADAEGGLFTKSVPATGGLRSFCATENGAIHVDAKGGDIQGREACLKLPLLE